MVPAKRSAFLILVCGGAERAAVCLALLLDDTGTGGGTAKSLSWYTLTLRFLAAGGGVSLKVTMPFSSQRYISAREEITLHRTTTIAATITCPMNPPEDIPLLHGADQLPGCFIK